MLLPEGSTSQREVKETGVIDHHDSATRGRDVLLPGDVKTQVQGPEQGHDDMCHVAVDPVSHRLTLPAQAPGQHGSHHGLRIVSPRDGAHGPGVGGVTRR